MSDPIRHLEAFYEACDQANPSRMLPDPALQPRIRARIILGWAFSALGPLFVGGALAFLLLTVGATLSLPPSSGGGQPMLDNRLKQAGLSREDLSIGPRLPQGRTEVRSWRV